MATPHHGVAHQQGGVVERTVVAVLALQCLSQVLSADSTVRRCEDERMPGMIPHVLPLPHARLRACVRVRESLRECAAVGDGSMDA